MERLSGVPLKQGKLFDAGTVERTARLTGSTEERLKKLLKVKLDVEAERNKWRHRFKVAKYRYQVSVLALQGEKNAMRKYCDRITTRYLAKKAENVRLIERMDEVTKDYDRLFAVVGNIREKVKCPKCGNEKHFDAFPRDPSKTLGRDLSRCNNCQAQKLRKYRKQNRDRG